MMRRAVLLATVWLLGAAGSGATETPAGWSATWNFLVESVCADAQDRALIGVSPLDPACRRPRKLRIGERLPYHKRDWPGVPDRSSHPTGYQQSDSVPLRTALGPAVVQTYDFGDGARAFGRFDDGDGGQVAFFTGETASFGITEDGSAGLQLFLGPGCMPTDSWVIVDRTFAARSAGSLLAHLTRRPDLCASRLNLALTRWHVQPVSYRAATGGRTAGPVVLDSLVSEHFGGAETDTADHLERMYFTRELGFTRWERWQNFSVHDRARDHRQAADLAASERCPPALPPPSAAWAMTDCREWTQMVPPADTAGDAPTFWIDRLQDAPATRRYVAPE